MAIVQISKIQQRSGNLVDLPQLDDAEFGWASDEKRLFIGKSTPNENIEVLTSYSNISFSQINGANGGNFNISNAQTGQILTYVSSTDTWENYKGSTSQLNGTKLQLGNVGNISMTGGAIGYVLETDGTGNLSWAPKGALYTPIKAMSNANPIVMTVANSVPYTNNTVVTISGVLGSNANTIVNGKAFYIQLANDFATTGNVKLYTSSGGSGPVDGTNLSATVDTGIATSLTGSTGGTSNVGGSNTTVLFNNQNISEGSANLTFDFANNILTVNGNANVGNLNATGSVSGSRLISNVATGTAPLVITSTTLVPNLYVARANVSDNEVVTAQTTGTFYPVFVNGNTTANYALGSNANISFNAATGNLSTTLLNVGSNANVGNLGTGGLIVATGNITGGNVNATTAVVAPQIVGNSNGNGTNFKIGDDAFIGDINITNTVVLKGQQDGANGYIVFGNNDTTSTLGRAGAGPLTYNGAFTAVGNANVGNLGTARILATANITAPQLISNVATGTAPLIVTSPTLVANLNADFLDGYNTSTTSAVNSVVVRDASASFSANVITANSFSGNIDTAAQPNITSLGRLTGLVVGNSTANSTFGNGTIVLTSAGNITGGNLVSASFLTGTLTTAAQPNITSVGTLTNLSCSGNISASNISATGTISATGNISGGNVSGTLLTGTLTTNAQPNITSVGTLTSLAVGGHIIPSANITYDLGNATNAFRDLYLSGASIKLGNAGATISANATAVLITNPGGNIVPLKPGGSNTQVQYNDDGVFGGNAGMVFDEGTTTLTVNNFAVTNNANLSSTTLTIKNITTGANTTQGNITGNWVLTAGSKMQATYADLAEYYEADKDYEPGTVLEFGGEKEVTLAQDGTSRVAGVVSTDPAYAMNMKCPGLAVAIALQGRVPTKVRGTIRKGDMMVSGGNGFARPSSSPQMGTVIGKALENFDGIEGVIEIAVGRL